MSKYCDANASISPQIARTTHHLRLNQMHIKVQRPIGVMSVAAIVENGLPKDGERLTFCAYSDEMKARVLERIAVSKESYTVSPYNGPKGR